MEDADLMHARTWRGWAACALLCLALPLAARAEDGFLLRDEGITALAPADLRERPAKFAFPPGERLTYRIAALGLPVGTARLEVARWIRWGGRRIAHVVATGDTSKGFSLFYPVHDRMEAWIDVDTLRTVRTATWTRHGRHKESLEFSQFDWEAHFVERVEEERHRHRLRETGADLGPDALDPFEAFYAARSIPLAPGARTRLPVVSSRKIYELVLEVDRADRIEWQGAPVDTWVVKPSSRLDGEPMGNGLGELRVGLAARQAPLRLDGWFETTGGFRILGVRARLVEYEPGDPAWPAAEAVPRSDPAFEVVTEEGRPQWTVPTRVAAVRRERGLAPYSRKSPLDEPRFR